MSEGLLLDTHTAIWLMDGSPMSKPSRSAIRAAVQTPRSVLLSPITAWEVALAQVRGRVTIPQPVLSWYEAIITTRGFAEAPLTADILVASEQLPEPLHRDPADRFLIATARQHGLRLVTRDRKILAYGAAGHVLTLAC